MRQQRDAARDANQARGLPLNLGYENLLSGGIYEVAGRVDHTPSEPAIKRAASAKRIPTPKRPRESLLHRVTGVFRFAGDRERETEEVTPSRTIDLLDGLD